MNIKGAVAVVTGAASGIGRALSEELARRGSRAIALVDHSPAVFEVVEAVNKQAGFKVAAGYKGDVTNSVFRTAVYSELHEKHRMVNICVSAAGITRDGLAVKVDKQTEIGRASW